jgi:putative ABC transport system permease protein
MSLWRIAWRSIQQRTLASTLTVVSMGLGVMLVVIVLLIGAVMNHSFRGAADLGYNVIVGAKGSPLQLTLNTIYHLDRPIENIPYWFYQEFLPKERRRDGRDGRYAAAVQRAIPCCMGDYFQGYRVVGTTAELFEPTPDLRGPQYRFVQGRNFKPDHFFEAVVGSVVARQARVKDGDRERPLRVGDRINPTHGTDGPTHDPFEVVGILAPTGTPNDRAVFVNIEGFLLLDGHARPVPPPPPEFAPGPGHHHDPADPHHHEAHAAGIEHTHSHESTGAHSHGPADAHGHAPLPLSQREVTSILIRTRGEGALADLNTISMIREINKGNYAQAVLPIREISRFLDAVVRPFQNLLLALTALIVVVSGISILVSIYNSMSERRHEIAVMRALGAGRGTVMLIVLLESILLALAGGFLGWLAGHVTVGLMGPWLSAQTSVPVGFLQFMPEYELILIPGLIVLAIVVGYLPALAAYRTDVAKAMAAAP